MAIKMICSDIDGTLLQYGRQKLEGEIFDQIRALHNRGILFCPASGRQYTSLRLLFEPVADCCVFLCENGGVLFKEERIRRDIWYIENWSFWLDIKIIFLTAKSIIFPDKNAY